MMDKIGMVLLCIYGVVNLAVFLLYGIDKLKAKHDKWRIPEKTLIIAAVLGILCGLTGMMLFHHKTKNPKFSVGLPMIFFAETALVAVVYFKFIR